MKKVNKTNKNVSDLKREKGNVVKQKK